MNSAECECPACGERDGSTFFEVRDAPVNSVVLLRDEEEARSFPSGDIELVLCRSCGFIFNQRYDPSVVEYSDRYEETQGFSPTFRAFHDRLADRLIEKYDLDGDHVVEIGCGKGEFLDLICRRSGSAGTGFDPAFVSGRSRVGDMDGGVRVVKEYFSADLLESPPDFLCCKMTLEHIPAVRSFLEEVYRSVATSPDASVFFQVPDTSRILEERAFWDVYYEHCSYFTAASIRNLFDRAGFEVEEVWTDYDDQYLMIGCRPGRARSGGAPGRNGRTIDSLAESVEQFSEKVDEARGRWDERLAGFARNGDRTVLWGGGSKAVAFLTCLSDSEAVDEVVDINPHKHGTYLPGTGHRVVGPSSLEDAPPERVIVMNPVYEEEIRSDLADRGLSPRILPINE